MADETDPVDPPQPPEPPPPSVDDLDALVANLKGTVADRKVKTVSKNDADMKASAAVSDAEQAAVSLRAAQDAVTAAKEAIVAKLAQLS